MTAGELTLGEEIGAGALGTVVRANRDGRTYAVKLLHASVEGDPSARERFLREAAFAEDLDHPNVVRVFGLTELEGRIALLMEYVEGTTLEEAVARGAPLPEARIRRIGSDVARGLAAAHDRGVIHRDLKPANVLLADGDRAKVADFGLARGTCLAGVDRDRTLVGTPSYMAPESVTGGVDPRTDLYALGCILFEMMNGRPPYGGATALDVLDRHRTETIPEPDPEGRYSASLTDLVKRLLSKSPADRPQSAALVAELLDRSTSLAPSTRDDLFDQACPECGALAAATMGLCPGCGAALLEITPGRASVLIIGPGTNADKLPASHRDRLLDWLNESAGPRLDTTTLRRHIPRIPFVLVQGVSEASGEALKAGLERLGFDAVVVDYAPKKHPALKEKLNALKRRGAIAGGASTILFQIPNWMNLVGVPVWLAAPAFILFIGGGFYWMFTRYRSFRRPHVRLLQRASVPLPEALTEATSALGKLAEADVAIAHRREAAGVVARALRLAHRMKERADRGSVEDLARSVRLAIAAAMRLDTLDRRLADVDPADPTEAQRRLMRERDTWSARLLGLAASLDALSVRIAGADAATGTLSALEQLEDLEARIEGLEEVQSL